MGDWRTWLQEEPDAALLLALGEISCRPGGVVFCGEAGCGKAALVEALLEQWNRPYMLVEPERMASELALGQTPRVLHMVAPNPGAGAHVVGWDVLTLSQTVRTYPSGLLVLERVECWGRRAQVLATTAQTCGWPVVALCSAPVQRERTAGSWMAYWEEIGLAGANSRAVFTHSVLVEQSGQRPRATVFTMEADPLVAQEIGGHRWDAAR